MLYFAHGSNLDREQMHVRCPAARLVGKARLDGYRHCFPRQSRIRLSAVASVEPAAGEAVWGMLHEIADGDIVRLDEREGVSSGRRPEETASTRVTVTVRFDRALVEAETHLAVAEARPGLPTPEYIAFLVRLAEACDLPRTYVASLRAIKTRPLAA
jgi:hypothetical protein